ncbi:MAG: hypothetical protein AB4372_10605 [Xenococcus sp. (in: cyanobacteria)]
MQQFIELPQPPTLNVSTNVNRRNKYAGAALKKKWTNAIAEEAKQAGLKPYQQEVWLAIELTYPHKGCDPDNLFACLKPVFDGLTKAKVIRNDNAKTIQTPIFYSFVVEDTRLVRLWMFDSFEDHKNFIFTQLYPKIPNTTN